MIIRQHLGLIFALVIALTLKAVLLAFDVFPFNADEAVVALMARHILQGARPVFFYGQSYLGSLDAWLIAFAFLILGSNRIGDSDRANGFIYWNDHHHVSAWSENFDKWVAASAALLLAIPTILTTLYTTATLGGYGEVLLIGNILLLWTLRLIETKPEGSQRPFGFGSGLAEWFLFGLLAGVGFWGFGFLGIYFPPIAIAILYHYFKSRKIPFPFFLHLPYLLCLHRFCPSAAPLVASHTLRRRDDQRIGRGAFAGDDLWRVEWTALRFVNLIILGFPVIIGMRPPWSVKWLALPLAPLAIIVILGAMVWAVLTSRRDWRRALLLGVSLTLMIAFVVTQFGLDPSGSLFSSTGDSARIIYRRFIEAS